MDTAHATSASQHASVRTATTTAIDADAACLPICRGMDLASRLQATIQAQTQWLMGVLFAVALQDPIPPRHIFLS